MKASSKEAIHQVLSPQMVAKQIARTPDDIGVYEVENLYVDICEVDSLIEVIGCTSLGDGTILGSCINEREHLYERLGKLCIPNDVDPVLIDNACALVRIWSFNYFHFLVEVCDKILIAEECGFKGQYVIYKNADAEKILTLMGVALDRVIWVEPKDIGKKFLIKKAIEIDGVTIWDKKTLPRVSAWCHDIVTNLVRNDNQEEYPQRLYVKRIGRRKLLGIERILKKYNFHIFVPEEHTLEEEIKYFYNADIVLCPHGAAIGNALFMRKGTAVVETCPCNFSNCGFGLSIAKERGLRYRQVVEQRIEPIKEEGINRDYSVYNPLLDYILKELIEHEC